MERKKRDTDRVMEGLQRLAFGEVNDAVRLAFSDQLPSPEVLAGLDLFNVASITHDKGGGVEIRFFDRLRALEKMHEYAHAGQNGAAAASLLEALTGADDHAV